MPYVFGFLVAVNVVLFGYFWFMPNDDTGTLDVAKTQLQRPLNYKNNTHNIPPLVGEK